MDALTLPLTAAALIFGVALVFSMLGLGGGMLYVPKFQWLALPLKTVAIPLSLLLNGVTTLSAFLHYWREGLVDFRGGLQAALAAMAAAPLGAWCIGFMPRRALLGLFATFTALASLHSLRTGERETATPPSPRC